MIRQHSPDGTPESFALKARDDAKGPEATAYFQWMREVLQPLNERAAELIFQHADLLDSPALWPLMLQLVAHVSALKVTMAQWQRGERTPISILPYPDKLLNYARRYSLRNKIK